MAKLMDWDVRYREELKNPGRPPREWLTDHADLLRGGGVCFEPAMGLAWNFPFLFSLGYTVWGVEISAVAARYAARLYPQARVILCDLSRFSFAADSFNLISHFFFLDLDLMRQYDRFLKPGGLVIMETLTVAMLSIHPDTPPQRLLKPGQLGELFTGWQILDYREGWVEERAGHPKSVASIVARKI